MKKVLAGMLACFLLMSLFAGCNQGSPAPSTQTTDTSASSGQTDTSSAPSAQTEASPASSTQTEEPKPVTITYLTWRANGDSFPGNFVADFEKKYPYITVDYSTTGVDIENYVATQKTRFLSNEDIDVTSIRPETLEDYVKAGYLEELTNQPFLSNYNPSMLDELKVDGKLYSVPSSLNLLVVYYNVDMFNKLGITIPTNWDEYLAVCEKLKANNITPEIAPGKEGWPMYVQSAGFPEELLVKDPDLFKKIDQGEVKYTDPIWVNMLTQINDYYKMGYLSKNVLAYDGVGVENEFKNGNAAMYFHGEWIMGDLSGDNAPSFQVGIFPMPFNAPGEDISLPISIGVSEAVSTSSPNKDAAMKFIEYMSSVEGGTSLSKNLNAFSPVIGVPSDFSPMADKFTALFKLKSVDFFWNEMYSGASSEYYKGLQAMFAGQMTPQQVAEAMQKEQDSKDTSQ